MKKIFGVVCVLVGIVAGYMFLNSPKEASMNLGWNLVLVNDEYYVPKDFDIDLVELDNGKSVDQRIYPYLQEMFDDMRKEGVFPIVASGYRTSSYQQQLLDQRIEAYESEGHNSIASYVQARKWVALPNHSEHNLGIAVDINNDEKSTSSEVYDWLDENAYKYGFIKRYPNDKISITHINYEPWHYRYVGYEHAIYMYTNNLCLEEYIEILNSKKS